MDVRSDCGSRPLHQRRKHEVIGVEPIAEERGHQRRIRRKHFDVEAVDLEDQHLHVLSLSWLTPEPSTKTLATLTPPSQVFEPTARQYRDADRRLS